ncbi:hypothetical protein E4U57_001998 [Claviceps arundinis]|uniref:Uncharacterized protein n=1 Tax=Claviceps arundinis TaxID=1623583 RepID=A0A9P7N102_9HYPO|nr:hypothetical protein E4U57_001998 [Claviceps arundinis]KAG5978685.1 hypothetical protein E4U56_000125 [Claviceps arundinis]
MEVGGFALVTGAASGVGKACATAFIKEGAAGVALVDINETALQTMRAEIEDLIANMEPRAEASGSKGMPRRQPLVATYVLDVTDEIQVQHVVEEAAANFGRLDYVVNAAGVVGAMLGGVASAPMEDWKHVLNINLDGTLHVLRAAAHVMLKQLGPNPGSIVNIASVLGVRSMSNSAAYTTSKHAVVGLTRSAAIDYAKERIRINAICPGYTYTPLLKMNAHIREMVAGAAAEIPMGRLARAEEIADGVLFLAGGRSSYVTGTTLMIDGGYTAK